ncbi:uncharacterized protein LOC141527169 isoform X2 [Cotesia typhae]|uniref:uncharacterized protein LOC141527169 isoform X2 n=1 Tax=Cotesia typhae TaxID=2053667 RepID=UPI003D69DB19
MNGLVPTKTRTFVLVRSQKEYRSLTPLRQRSQSTTKNRDKLVSLTKKTTNKTSKQDLQTGNPVKELNTQLQRQSYPPTTKFMTTNLKMSTTASKINQTRGLPRSPVHQSSHQQSQVPMISGTHGPHGNVILEPNGSLVNSSVDNSCRAPTGPLQQRTQQQYEVPMTLGTQGLHGNGVREPTMSSVDSRVDNSRRTLTGPVQQHIQQQYDAITPAGRLTGDVKSTFGPQNNGMTRFHKNKNYRKRPVGFLSGKEMREKILALEKEQNCM